MEEILRDDSLEILVIAHKRIYTLEKQVEHLCAKEALAMIECEDTGDNVKEATRRGELEIERLDHGYVVRILNWGDGWDTPPICRAFEDVQGVADEVMLWLGYDVNEEAEDVVYVAGPNFPTEEELDVLKRGSGRQHTGKLGYGDGATW